MIPLLSGKIDYAVGTVFLFKLFLNDVVIISMTFTIQSTILCIKSSEAENENSEIKHFRIPFAVNFVH